MGSVWVAEHILIGKEVAIKILHPQLASDSQVVRRFLQEARAAAAIKHPNLVEVHDVGKAPDGSPYFVMDFLEGETLGTRLEREGRLPVEHAVSVLLPILSALDAAHRKGFIHRDIKPDNVFIDRTASVRLLDFGISKMKGDVAGRVTRTGGALGTPQYMAPEQARGEKHIDGRVDIYAIGVVLYEALTGAVPHEAENYNALMVRIMTEAPPLPRSLRPDLPAALESIVLRAIAKAPDARFATAEELRRALVPFAGTEIAHAAAPAPSPQEAAAPPTTRIQPPQTVHWDRKTLAGAWRRGLVVGAAAGLLGLGAFAFWALSPRADPVASQPAAGPPPVFAAAPFSALPDATARPAVVAAPTLPLGAEPPDVLLRIVGAPDGSRVAIGGRTIDGESVRVLRSATALEIRVVAPGMRPWSHRLVPDEDRLVEVRMRPLRAIPKRAVKRPARPAHPAAQVPDWATPRTAAAPTGTARNPFGTSSPSTSAPAQNNIIRDTSEFRPR